MKILVTQSNFFPWRGFYTMLLNVDKVIFLDNVQYTKRDWRNRNIFRRNLKTNEGQWITMPVVGGGSQTQSISQVLVADYPKFIENFFNKMKSVYGKSEYFTEMKAIIDWCSIFQSNQFVYLSEFNRLLTSKIADNLGLPVKMYSELLPDFKTEPSQRILDIVIKHGGSVYLTGPKAKSYLDNSRFLERNIEVRYADFKKLPLADGSHSSLGYEFSILDSISRLGLKKTRESISVKLI